MADLRAVVDDVVRRERGRIIGGLLRMSRSLDAAEEAFQDAALSALEAWRDDVPINPGAWLMTAAKNKVTDARRRQAVADAKAPLLVDPEGAAPEALDAVNDDYLRLILTCCHPALTMDNRIALTLKVVCGFSTEEIARAFMSTEATISQRILRAKQTLEEKQVPYATPERTELDERVASALGVVYAMFNEGHVARTGALMRLDLQAQALRLARLLADLVPREPEAYGALAIMAFAAARAATRVDDEGLPILLEHQDRARWDRTLVREGLMALQRARTLGGRGAYVLQAEIAALHVIAPTWESTRWADIVARYDALVALTGSKVVALNRGIALSMVEGPEAGLLALAELERDLADYHLFFAARADMRERAGGDSRGDLERALALATNDAERRLLTGRLERTIARRG